MSGTAAKPRRRVSAKERRRIVLDAAVARFGEKGYDHASLREIAADAGVTTPVLYDHFPSKAELYVAVAWELADSLLEHWSAPIEGPPEQIFRVTVARIFEWIEANPAGSRVFFAELPSDELVARNIAAVLDRALSALAELFGTSPPARLPAGLDRERANEALASLTMSAVSGLAGWWLHNPDVPRETVVSLACEVLWSGLAELSGAAPKDRRREAGS
jgi:AcrR family transcriptional regulator